MLRHPDSPVPAYDEHVELDLASVEPSLAGPRMPHERVTECELPFHPNRIMLHDTTCLPALAEFGGMRDAVAELGGDPNALQPAIPVDLTVDHSVIAEQYGRPDARELNLDIDFRCNSEHYR